MLEQLSLNNFHSGLNSQLPETSSCFVLKTCQRTLIVSMQPIQVYGMQPIDQLTGKEAYNYLLQIICGLKSKLIGENEIVNQFKLAYQQYAQNPQRCSNTLLILEKLFKDAKEVRTKYLIGLSQKTYSSITRKYILGHRADSVLILGSGQLAEDLINQFKKKIKVYISGRNTEKIKALAKFHQVETVAWKDFDNYAQFPFIANSIGCSNNKFILESFFTQWDLKHQNKLFVDLGSPSVIETKLQKGNGVIRLEEVFEEGAIHEDHKLKQIENAKNAMTEIVQTREKHLLKKSKKQNNYNVR